MGVKDIIDSFDQPTTYGSPIYKTHQPPSDAATVALATLGLDQTRVELWADPGVSDNQHEIEAWGEAGHLLLRLDNRPDPLNPRTSLVTAHSALRAVLNWRAPLVL